MFPRASRHGIFDVEVQLSSRSDQVSLFVIDNWLASAKDFAFVGERFFRVLNSKQVFVGQPEHVLGLSSVELCASPADRYESTLEILEIDPVGEILHQRRQQATLFGQRQFGPSAL
jgi:hypothetical protein